MLCLGLALSACAPREWPAGPATGSAHLATDAVLAPDGARLPMHAWPAEGQPRAVVLALHGLNDHSGLFLEDAGPLLAEAGIALYAYDQRGFGAAPDRGLWAGVDTLVDDARSAIALLRTRHPGLPLVLMGESMGGAVALLAGEGLADRVVLLAPALWNREAMGPALSGLLWFAAHTLPILGFQNSAPGYRASDNDAALRRMGRDPLVLHTTRVEVLWGVTNLMDAAVASLPACCQTPTLVLVGAKDQIVPQIPVRRALRGTRLTVARYEEGYHLLLRDSIRDTVAQDLLAWIAAPGAALPSGADAAGRAWLSQPDP
ncbi:alpha-beta hydrolase superfamily lysophospholipase [Humitalea rosea]|uniref:Alpha-beta hydrolase superfamily lysophospholipase n=1 Tax=Humitalea rosea TaxID=990373 RepID=A0A2W7IKQ2_9PROT|nr:alpha-beta hydrolase superfamily lysophospholipase [Humitalea rosea]